MSQRVDCKTEIEATGRMSVADLTVSKRELINRILKGPDARGIT